MQARNCRVFAAALAAFALAAFPAWNAAGAAEPDFAAVAAILNARCVMCHSGEDAPLGLKLDSLQGLKAGSSNGAVAVPAAPAESELIRRLKGLSEPRMPLTGPPFLDDTEIALIESWIAAGMPEGASLPAEAAPSPRPGPGEPVLFADVAPIFLKRCVKCHTDDGLRGPPPQGLRLKTRDLILAGGERVVVVPGKPGASELVRRIRGQSLPRMPFDGPPYLDDEQIRLITDWIAQGAPDDEGNPASIPAGAPLRLEGTLTGIWELDGTELTMTPSSRIDKNPRVGNRVEVRGTVGPGGSVIVTRLRPR